MENFNRLISRINFKKVVFAYLIITITVGILSAGALGFLFRDKLEFAYAYHSVSEKIEHNRSGLEAVKPSLTNLAEQSPDLVDILILNSENKIIFSAKNSELSQSGRLELTGSSGKENRYLIDKANPDVRFRFVKNDSIALSKAILGMEDKVERNYEDDYFYEAGFFVKKVYLLSYIVDKTGGDKIYFISNVQPVANGEFSVKAVAALVMLLFMIYWVLLALWVYANALKSRLNAPMWGIVTLLTNLAGLFIYLIYRQNRQTCFKCGTVQNRANLYCTSCGTRLGEICKNCHTPVDGGDNYCKNCGSEINREAGKL